MKNSPQDVKTSTHATRYFFVGIAVTAFNYAFYAILANLIIRNNDFLWLSTFISTAVTIIVAYVAHSKITWKERCVTKHSIIRFFIWNILFAVAVGPWLTQLFSLITPLYEFTYNITSAIHLPFSYEFVLTTGAFALTSIVIMVLNFLFYDKFVFGSQPKSAPALKIVFPEVNSNRLAKQAATAFPDIDFLPADSLIAAAKMLQNHQVNSLISGIDFPSRDVVIACKDYLPLKSKYFSSCFICQKDGKTFALADGGINKQPTKEQLYTIIEDTAETFIKYTGKKPVIALLSYSTHGSGGKNPDLAKYHFCIDKIRRNHPEYLIDGDLQLDAAVNPRIRKKKAPDSPLKGPANILITPDLNSGNILYKSLEQLGNYAIAGPIIQGFQVPLADLSRGSTTEDIILTINVLRSLL